ncbi:GNAT family N-acetyltransferase [Myroides sp. LJL119]
MILRKAKQADIPIIWEILAQAIQQRKQDGSTQWQNGYPNLQTLSCDIDNGYGYVVEQQQEIMAYGAIIFDVEPTYLDIKGSWLTNNPYLVIHRVATSKKNKSKGVATQFFKMIEDLALQNNTYSIRVDTNFDNIPMLKIFDKLGYSYCGEIFVNQDSRMAYEKVLTKKD